jgi:hypothetical protein
MSRNIQMQFAHIKNNFDLWRLNRQINKHAKPDSSKPTIVVFNASSRIYGISQNAAFTLLTSWGLRLAGIQVKHFVCKAGMSHCVLGTNREDFSNAPPCQACIRQSKRMYQHADVFWFSYNENKKLSDNLDNLSVEELSNFEYNLEKPYHSLKTINKIIPIGRLVLPSVRWALRRHHLIDNNENRYLIREYILSAFNIILEFAEFLDQTKASNALIFNGILFPEAAARWIAIQKGVRVITQEVSFQPFSAFYTTGEATAYPIHIPEEFTLSESQNERLDNYLEKRIQGKFTMAGIKFWQDMQPLDEQLLIKISEHKQLVTVFTNVVYDTSQVHANQVFPHMFAWLDLILKLIKKYPKTLFVIRAHPDEMRPGTAKQSNESVRDWILKNQINLLPNTHFIDSQEYISSYDLINRSKFIMVYNSSIGMEATLMGKPVLCGGKARYTQYPIVFFPQNTEAFQREAEILLELDTVIVPDEFIENARRFLYYQLYRASLSFKDFLKDSRRKGFIEFKPFSWKKLLEYNSPAIQTLVNGIANEQTDNSFQVKEIF